jgi:hypothetical protein
MYVYICIFCFQKVEEGAVAGFGSYEYDVVYQASPKRG